MNIFNTYVISDTHFGHGNMCILRNAAGVGGFSCRDEDQMDDMIIDNWNSVVSEKDHVVILGDFAWRPKNFPWLMKVLHGKKTLVTGNHDTRDVRKSPLWESVSDILRLRLGEESNSPKAERVELYCCHYPMRTWNKSFHVSFHLYGHTHCDDMRDRREFNVGVDVSIDPYQPRQVAKLLSAMLPRWFPRSGRAPLPDGDPVIMREFRENYGKPFSMKDILAERERMAQDRGMLDKPLGQDETWQPPAAEDDEGDSPSP